MECSVFNWRIWLGGAASAAILTAGVAAPAFAAPRASTPNPLSGITQGDSGSQAGGVFCALPSLPVSVGVTAAAGAIGESCGSAQASGTSESSVNGQQGPFVAKPAGQDSGQGNGQGNGQSNGPARTASTPQSALSPQASGAPSALPGLNSVSGVIPGLSAPDLGSVTGAVSGGAGNLTGSGQNGGPATGPLP
jgi:trimeric autotransporter adhesin